MIRPYLRISIFAALASTGALLAQESSPETQPSPSPSASPAATATPAVTATPEVKSENREAVDAEMAAEDKPIKDTGEPKPNALANEVEAEISNADASAPLDREGAAIEEGMSAADDVEGPVESVTETADPLPEPVPGDLGLGAEEMDFLPTGEVSPDEIPDPNALFPDDFVPGDMPPPAPAVAENEFERDRKLRVRFQEVKSVALKDEAIREMKERANRAKTAEDKRAALREHYKMLFAKIVSIDAELAERCALMETAYLRRLAQFRVEPTIPLNPPPTPEPLN
ncbi:MAG: hypothetical protein ACOVMP_02755 [Chthoniobacterales bacterium]